jgi:hypothetical protein
VAQLLAPAEQGVVVDRGEVVDGQTGAVTEEGPDPVRAVGRGERGADLRALGTTALVGRDEAAVGSDVDPVPVGAPAGPATLAVAGGHPSGPAVADRAVHVGHDDVVDGLDPVLEGGVDVVHRAGAEQRQERLEPDVAELGRRPAEPDAGHDGRPVVVVRDGEQVLVVGHRVGDRPGHVARVREVLDARRPGEREPDDVEGVVGVVAGEPDLVVDAGRLERAVGVAPDQRKTGRRPASADGPGVAAGRQRTLVREQRGVLAESSAHTTAPQGRPDVCEQHLLGVEGRQWHPLRPRLGAQPGGDQLGRGGGGRLGQGRVEPVDVRRHERARLLPQRVERPARGVDHADPCGEAVPRLPRRTEHRTGGAGGATAQPLQLPRPVTTDREPLAPGEVEHVVRPHVRDAVRVAVDPGHGA